MALRLGHRESEDFDFFSTEPFEPRELQNAVPYLRGARVTQREENTLTCAVGQVSVKVSFFGGVNIRAVHKPDLADNGLRIASLLDVAATKAAAVQSRAARKDYDDMAAIIVAGMSLGDILGAAAAVFGTASFNPLITLKALAHHDDKALRDQAGRGLSRSVRETLTRAIQDVDLSTIRIPDTQPKIYEAGQSEQ